ncbi:MAG: TetR/AcrR family transcriptional regulator [Alphaproteobacteria bacterium]|nr:TetR/AcrR family transcriptional regulator [Alphaproteobacteria bacterium]
MTTNRSSTALKAAPGRKSLGKAGTGSGGLRSELKQFTRARLISAAMEAFATEGFKATTVERIVEMAGTTAPTFYRHFASKNDLLVPLEERLTEETRVVIEAFNDVETIDYQSMRAWLRLYERMWRRIHKLCVAYWEAVEQNDEVAANALPSALSVAVSAEGFLERYDPARREIMTQRVAMLIPLVDRLMQVALRTTDAGLGKGAIDDFARMMVLVLGDTEQAAASRGR